MRWQSGVTVGVPTLSLSGPAYPASAPRPSSSPPRPHRTAPHRTAPSFRLCWAQEAGHHEDVRRSRALGRGASRRGSPTRTHPLAVGAGQSPAARGPLFRRRPRPREPLALMFSGRCETRPVRRREGIAFPAGPATREMTRSSYRPGPCPCPRHPYVRPGRSALPGCPVSPLSPARHDGRGTPNPWHPLDPTCARPSVTFTDRTSCARTCSPPWSPFSWPCPCASASPSPRGAPPNWAWPPVSSAAWSWASCPAVRSRSAAPPPD